MKLEQLYLKKEELPILYANCFQIPIHSKLLNENIKIDEDIAKKIFPQVAEEWYVELKEYTKTLENEKKFIEKNYLKQKPKIENHLGQQILNWWKDNITLEENGFVSSFCIDRDFGGTLYFLKEDRNCQFHIPNGFIKFSKEKSKEFEIKEDTAFVYSQHNITSYPGALFLRNWAILYMNEVFKQIFS